MSSFGAPFKSSPPLFEPTKETKNETKTLIFSGLKQTNEPNNEFALFSKEIDPKKNEIGLLKLIPISNKEASHPALDEKKPDQIEPQKKADETKKNLFSNINNPNNSDNSSKPLFSNEDSTLKDKEEKVFLTENKNNSENKSVLFANLASFDKKSPPFEGSSLDSKPPNLPSNEVKISPFSNGSDTKLQQPNFSGSQSGSLFNNFSDSNNPNPSLFNNFNNNNKDKEPPTLFGNPNKGNEVPNPNDNNPFKTSGILNNLNNNNIPSIFGNNSMTGGIFSNPTNKNPDEKSGGVLFGFGKNNIGINNTNENPGGLFGNKGVVGVGTGGSLFGNLNSPATAGSLFGNHQQQQP